MANEFSNNAKVKILATEIYNNTPYLKKAKSYIPQEQMVGKKYGNTYEVYIPDPGKARIAKASDGKAGLSANVQDIKEVKYRINLEAALDEVELDEWEKLGDIESFTDQVAIPRGRNMAQTIEKYAVEKTVFDAAQAVVGTKSLATIAKANGKLAKVGNAGSKVTYIDPVVGSEIAAVAAGQIKNDEIVSKLYKDAAIGTFAGVPVVSEMYMPKINSTTGDAIEATLTATSDGKGFAPLTSVSFSGQVGVPYSASNLFVVDKNGIQTNEPYCVIPLTTAGNIHELRVEFEGENLGNANAWMPKSTSSTTPTFVNMLTTGKDYTVVQSRQADAVAFDDYEFGKIPGSEMEKAEKEAITLQTYKFGNGNDFSTLVRLVAPFAVGMPDNRSSVLAYIEA